MEKQAQFFFLQELNRAGGGTRLDYDTIYQTQGIRQLDSFYLWLLDLVQPVAGRRLLDVSCGEGSLTRFAVQRGLIAHGVDISWVAIKQACQESNEVNYLVGDGEQLPYREHTFDYVTNIGSLEHFVDMAAGIREMTRVLKPDGVALILLPNTYSLFGNILSAIKYGVTFDDGQPIQRYAALNEWRQLLQINGLRVVRVIKYEREFPQTLDDIGWYLAHPKSLVRLMLTPFIPTSLAWCFAYLCRPVTP